MANQWSGGTIVDLVMQHDKDLYRGNGLPGLTTRMKCVEDEQEVHTQQLKDIKNMFWAIVLLLLTLFGGVVTDVLMKTKSPTAGISLSTPTVAQSLPLTSSVGDN